MKKLQIILIFIFIIVCIGSFSESAYAGKQKYICSVDKVGFKGSEDTRVMLTDESGAFTQKWFKCNRDRAKEMLALLLTAINGTMQVEVKFDPDQEGMPEIDHLYMFAP
jgi:hypothetical protein